jgi:serine/threonine protein kinase
VSSQAKKIIETLLNQNPNKRPKAEELLQDPYFFEEENLKIESV